MQMTTTADGGGSGVQHATAVDGGSNEVGKHSADRQMRSVPERRGELQRWDALLW
jgi:hypothetical protein